MVPTAWGKELEMRIVLADDDDSYRHLVAITLKFHNYETLQATDGVLALDLVRRERPDLVILDVGMPRMSGLEVARALSQDPATASIPIIMLSARAMPADVAAGLAAGARRYLTKPSGVRQLANCVAELLGVPPPAQVW
jgi:DNA-binding response OmpR family regulator